MPIRIKVSNKWHNIPATDKLAEMVLHVSDMSEGDERFASVKLNKLIWAADFKAFCETGRTITGATYQKVQHGPVPKAMPVVLRKLQTAKRLKIVPAKMFNKTGKRPVALGQANLTDFSHKELGLIDKVIAENFGKNGSEMSDETHKYLAWEVAKEGESIPFSAWLVRKRKPTKKEKSHAAQLAAKLSK